jgi:hypothetical protein
MCVRVYVAKIAKSGLTMSSIELKQSLGDLYSVPSDANIPLAFERNDLRFKCATGEIQKYLEQVQKFFEDLSRVNGAFLVKDWDENGRYVIYEWSHSQGQSGGRRRPEEKHKYWMAAQPSLLAYSKARGRSKITPRVHDQEW